MVDDLDLHKGSFYRLISMLFLYVLSPYLSLLFINNITRGILCRNFGPEEKREKEGRKMIKDKKKCKSKDTRNANLCKISNTLFPCVWTQGGR